MKKILSMFLILVFFSVALSARNRSLDTPTGVTIQAKDSNLLLLWDRIDRVDLMGYSVWIRRDGKSEFTRLKIPMKIDGKIQKMPMTSRARLILKGLDLSRSIEFVVVSEYEDGRSKPSQPVFTHLAAGEISNLSESLEPQEEETTENIQADQKENIEQNTKDFKVNPTPVVTPFSERALAGAEDILLAGGTFRYVVGAGFVQDSLPYEYCITRHVILANVGIEYGVSNNFQLGIKVNGEYSRTFIDESHATPDDPTYDAVSYYWVNSQGGKRPNPFFGGVSSVDLTGRVKLYKDNPFVFSLNLRQPVGLSRFESWLNWFYEEENLGGGEKGYIQITPGFEYGYRGIRDGFFADGSLTLGGRETVVVGEPGDIQISAQAVYGDIARVTLGYTWLYSVNQIPGSFSLGIEGISKQASQYLESGTDVYNALMYRYPFWDGWFEEMSGISPYRDDQMKVFLEMRQSIVAGLAGTGNLYYISRRHGAEFGISGSVFY